MHCLINLVRKEAGLRKTRSSAALRHSATYKARRIAACKRFTHSPCGDRLAAPFHEADVTKRRPWYVGENLGWRTAEEATAYEIVRGWLASPSHRARAARPPVHPPRGPPAPAALEDLPERHRHLGRAPRHAEEAPQARVAVDQQARAAVVEAAVDRAGRARAPGRRSPRPAASRWRPTSSRAGLEQVHADQPRRRLHRRRAARSGRRRARGRRTRTRRRTRRAAARRRRRGSARRGPGAPGASAGTACSGCRSRRTRRRSRPRCSIRPSEPIPQPTSSSRAGGGTARSSSRRYGSFVPVIAKAVRL